MIDLNAASFLPMLPISQVPDVTVKPSMTVISENEFLILSWTGASTLGVFITGDGDPVRGTLEWPSYPEAVCKFLRLCFVILATSFPHRSFPTPPRPKPTSLTHRLSPISPFLGNTAALQHHLFPCPLPSNLFLTPPPSNTASSPHSF